jgi:hypothetical protein
MQSGGVVGRKVAKLHAGERLLKVRYLALRDALQDVAHFGPHLGTLRNQCAASCPACLAERALIADGVYGRIADDRPRKEQS